MTRLCSRTGCSRSAPASMSYGYGARTAWIDDLDLDLDLDPDHAPSGYDLCGDHADRLHADRLHADRLHADRLCVPRGWERDDRRTAGRPLLTRAG